MVIPVVLGTLFFWQLFDDITDDINGKITGVGFLWTAKGDWILANCVGLGIVALAPVVAIILSMVKGRRDVAEIDRPEEELVVGGNGAGNLAFVAALAVAGLLIVCLKVPMAEGAKQVIVWGALVGGIAAMLLSNYVLDRHHTSTSQAAWSARWAGILAAMDASAAIAMMLIGLAGEAKMEETAAPIRDKLSVVSYAILGVVFLIIIGGLGWSFYRALAAGKDNEIQHADEE